MTGLEALYWREPLWLMLALAPLLWLAAGGLLEARRWRRLADPHLVPWLRSVPAARRRRARLLAVIAGWALLCTALAGPRTPRWIPPDARPPALELMVVFDLSASMAARDTAPHRRGRARALMTRWLATLPADSGVGLAAFAGHGHLLLPVTRDHGLVSHFLAELAGLRLPTLGNDLAGALGLAATALEEGEGPRAVLLFSDGDLGDAARQAAETAARPLVAAGIPLHVVGVGGPEKARVPDLPGTADPILSRREGAWLAHLAALGGGRYGPADELVDLDLTAFLDPPPRRIDPAAATRVQWQEWFGLPLVGGLVLVLLAGGLPGRRAGAAGLAGMALALAAFGPEGARADGAAAALEAGDYATARRLYAGEQGYRARYGEGVACYRLEDYACARRAFAAAAWRAPDDAARGRAVFNLGNAHFFLGEYAQAAVLFAQAGELGVPTDLARRNLAYADSLAAMVRRHARDVERALARAEGGAAVAEQLSDVLAEGVYLDLPPAQRRALAPMAPERLAALVARGLEGFQGTGGAGGGAPGAGWVRTSAGGGPGSTAAVVSRVLEMELGFPAPLEEPRALEGVRPW